jgi:hypothetical protein
VISRNRVTRRLSSVEAVVFAVDALGHQVLGALGVLQFAGNAQDAAGQNLAAVAFGQLRPDDDVDDAGFVFQRQEDHARGGAGALAVGDHSGGFDAKAPSAMAASSLARRTRVPSWGRSSFSG